MCTARYTKIQAHLRVIEKNSNKFFFENKVIKLKKLQIA